jgi:hypothetical protein
LRRKIVSSALSCRFHRVFELDESGPANRGQQSGFIGEVPVRGRSRNTQPLSDFAQGERLDSLALDQFEPAFDQRGA